MTQIKQCEYHQALKKKKEKAPRSYWNEYELEFQPVLETPEQFEL